MYRMIHFDSIDSTHTWTKQNAHSLDPDQLTCVSAAEQTAGHGRFGRPWISPKDQNIYASFYFTLQKDVPYLTNLAQVLSFSCVAVLKNQGFTPSIKWPNDILLDGKKVAGILCELLFLENSVGVVLSIGLNVNMSADYLRTVDQPATSLMQVSGHPWQMEPLLSCLVEQFGSDLSRLKIEGFIGFWENYKNFF